MHYTDESRIFFGFIAFLMHEESWFWQQHGFQFCLQLKGYLRVTLFHLDALLSGFSEHLRSAYIEAPFISEFVSFTFIPYSWIKSSLIIYLKQ